MLDAEQPVIHIDDYGFLHGDGCFETLLVREKHPFNLDRHIDRMADSAQLLHIECPERQQWIDAIAVALHHWGSAEGMMRLLLSRGRESDSSHYTALVMIRPVPAPVLAARTKGVRLLAINRGYSLDYSSTSPWQLHGAKLLSYATNKAATRYAQEQGYDDGLYISQDGYVLEGPKASLIINRQGQLHTPSPDTGVLPGTTQSALFEHARSLGIMCHETKLRLADIVTADAVWMLSSVSLAVRVKEVDGMELSYRPSLDIEQLLEGIQN